MDSSQGSWNFWAEARSVLLAADWRHNVFFLVVYVESIARLAYSPPLRPPFPRGALNLSDADVVSGFQGQAQFFQRSSLYVKNSSALREYLHSLPIKYYFICNERTRYECVEALVECSYMEYQFFSFS